MSKKRVRLTQAQYDELISSRDWCAKNGYDGFVQWYNEELNFHARRRALPEGVSSPYDDDERR